jgi:DNA-binding transcriptional regulator PaaX
VSPWDNKGMKLECAGQTLRTKSDFMAAEHRQYLRQKVNQCWDLLQQQQEQAFVRKEPVNKLQTGKGLGE